jgi:hypothetical protein
VATVLDGAKVSLVQAFLDDLEVVAVGVQVEKLKCFCKLADDTQSTVFARELCQRREDSRKVDFVRLRPILQSTFRLQTVGLSQNLDVAEPKQFARRTVFYLAVEMVSLAKGGSTVGNTV